ncbi:MAG: HAD family hydrolase [Desulfobacterales bacterium]|nr:HAD family hydrolase [Desulfobacterales bacterium]
MPAGRKNDNDEYFWGTDFMSALVMFDYDGVIVDSFELFSACFMKACHQNNFYELNSPEKILALFETNVFEALLGFGLDDHSINRILETFQSDIGAYQNDMRLFDGISHTLRKISKKNKIVIITSNISMAAKQVLINNGIYCFEDVLGAEKEKSKVKKIRLTMARYPGLPAYYIGDTKGDMIEGRKAGAITVAALWGWHAVKKLEEGAPDHFVCSPEALLDLLD